MLILGFGCSFTQGTGVKEDDCWLANIAKNLQCQYINFGNAGNSNFAIAQNFAHFFNYEFHMYDEPPLVIVGWTQVDRMSWWDEATNHWIHSGQADTRETSAWIKLVDGRFKDTRKEWLAYSQSGNQPLTDSAKLLVNNHCEFNNIKFLQFNALGKHHTYHNYKNYYLPDKDTSSFLKDKERIGKGDLHPNEQGHIHIANRLIKFIKDSKII